MVDRQSVTLEPGLKLYLRILLDSGLAYPSSIALGLLCSSAAVHTPWLYARLVRPALGSLILSTTATNSSLRSFVFPAPHLDGKQSVKTADPSLPPAYRVSTSPSRRGQGQRRGCGHDGQEGGRGGVNSKAALDPWVQGLLLFVLTQSQAQRSPQKSSCVRAWI